MRREGYIIEEIIEYSNMSEAFDSVLRGTDRKRSRQGRFLLAHREKIITELTASMEAVSSVIIFSLWASRNRPCLDLLRSVPRSTESNASDILEYSMISSIIYPSLRISYWLINMEDEGLPFPGSDFFELITAYQTPPDA